MAVTFDGPNLRITLESGVTTISWQDVYSDWKRWVNDGGGDPYAPAFRVVGGDPLTGTLNAGTYYFLRNDLGWRIKPPEEDITIFAEGNLAAEDTAKDTIVPTTGAFTAAVLGVQPVSQSIPTELGPQIERMHGQLQREVWLDPTLGTDGNGYQQSPFNSLTSAIDYAEANGITGLVLLGDITLNRNLKNFQVRGVGRPTIDFAGFDLSGGTFRNVQLEGNYTSDILATECNLKTNARLNGEFRDCSLGGDLFCVAGATILLKNCSSSVAGLGRPTITMSNGGARVLLSVRSNNGGLTIKGSTHVDDEVTVEVNRGSLTFDSSNTAGSMVARTSGKFVDQTAGATVTTEIYAQEAWERLDLDSAKNNIYADDGTQITGSDWTLTRTDNGNGTSTVARS
jgi:hypothetical protein